jgi:hypothetical protein
MSKPGISGFGCTSTMFSAGNAVVPIVTDTSDFKANRNPVTLNSIMVGTSAVPLLEVTLNGSPVR